MRQIITAVDAVESYPGSIDKRRETRTQFVLRIKSFDHTQT